MAIRALKHLSLPRLSAKLRPLARLKQRAARRRAAPASDNDTTTQIAFTFAVIAMAAHLAETRGGMTQGRILAFCSLFGVPEEERDKVGHLLRLAVRDRRDARFHTKRINMLYPGDSARKATLMRTFFRLAEADGPPAPEELALLRRISDAFGLGEQHWLTLYHTHVAPRMEDPYATLGVRRGAGEAELREAYHARVRDCHPDLLAARGGSKGEVARAARDMAALNAAYDALVRTARKRA